MVKIALSFIFCINLWAINGSSIYNEAVSLYKNGKTEVAIEHLKKISPGTNTFKLGLETLLKIYYKKNDFSKFFATSVFYRSKYKEKSEVNEKVLGLEIFALAKNCQYEAAEKLIVDLKNNTQLNSEDVRKIEKSYRLMKSFSIGSNESADIRINKYTWKIDEKKLDRLKTPHNLRMKVRNLCKS